MDHDKTLNISSGLHVFPTITNSLIFFLKIINIIGHRTIRIINYFGFHFYRPPSAGPPLS